MDILKQLEAKLNALVQQRNTLREEVERLKVDREPLDQELHGIRRRMEDLQGEKAVLIRERDEVRQQIESIIKTLEDLA